VRPVFDPKGVAPARVPPGKIGQAGLRLNRTFSLFVDTPATNPI
jgi:hypothetical protein